MQLTQESQGLKVIKVNKEKLILDIEQNMKNHEVEFKEAMSGFLMVAVDTLNEELKVLAKGDIPSNVIFSVPESHVSDYQDIIDLLKMSVDDELEITYDQFKRYVKDDWIWSVGFKNLHAVYNNG
jgi:delta-aminolevulinic acid dehydratase/porphobilinogen synthase